MAANTLVLGFMVAWGVWVTNEIFLNREFRAKTIPGFTVKEAAALEAKNIAKENQDLITTSEVHKRLTELREGQLKLMFLLEQHLLEKK